MKKGSKIALAVMSAAIIAGSAAAFGGCGEKKKTISITGSTSVNEIMEVLAQKYEKDHNVRIQINAQGSGGGIQDAIAGRNDFGMASRALEPEEKSQGIEEKQLCIDGIVLAVSKDCAATKVTNDQIYALAMDGTPFEDNGATVNALAGREASSGTREAFDENVFDPNGKSIKDWSKDKTNPKAYSSAVSENTSTGTSINKVTSDSYHRTVAYISMGSYLANTSTLKALEFMARNDAAYVAPSVNTVKDGSYKMQRPFMIITRSDGSMSAEAKAFYEWLWGDDAMDIIESKGYVIQEQ